MNRHHYLISYDVADDKRRNQIFHALRDSGDHVQYSVFICNLNKHELALLRTTLTPSVNTQEDQIIILDLGPESVSLETGLECLGKGYSPMARVQIV
jgi:CRISPR-associated protein Cas2